ncbi:hypothetical protein EYW93_21500 [Escherichia coli]|nr:hypothetical protein [Escherichia coli]
MPFKSNTGEQRARARKQLRQVQFRLDESQKLDIKHRRTFLALEVPERAKRIDHSDGYWLKDSGVDVDRKELVRSLTHDISQQYGREMTARVTRQGNVEIERVKSLSRGFSISR